MGASPIESQAVYPNMSFLGNTQKSKPFPNVMNSFNKSSASSVTSKVMSGLSPSSKPMFTNYPSQIQMPPHQNSFSSFVAQNFEKTDSSQFLHAPTQSIPSIFDNTSPGLLMHPQKHFVKQLNLLPN